MSEFFVARWPDERTKFDVRVWRVKVTFVKRWLLWLVFVATRHVAQFTKGRVVSPPGRGDLI